MQNRQTSLCDAFRPITTTSLTVVLGALLIGPSECGPPPLPDPVVVLGQPDLDGGLPDVGEGCLTEGIEICEVTESDETSASIYCAPRFAGDEATVAECTPYYTSPDYALYLCPHFCEWFSDNPDEVTCQTEPEPCPQGLNAPHSVASDGERVYVSDVVNDRIMVWNDIPTTSHAPADVVLLQESMYTSVGESVVRPRSLCMDGSTLIAVMLTDKYWDSTILRYAYAHKELWIWSTAPTANNQAPDAMLQLVDAPGLAGPQAADDCTVVGDKLFMTDSGHNRVLIFDSFPTSGGFQEITPSGVLGQPDLETNDSGYFFSPRGITSDGDKLFVADRRELSWDYFHARIHIWNSIPTGDAPADVVLEQDYGFPSTWYVASDVFVDNGRLYAGTYLMGYEAGPAAVQIWDEIPTGGNPPADHVIEHPGDGLVSGGADFGGSIELFVKDEQLFVVDGRNRVVIRPVP